MSKTIDVMPGDEWGFLESGAVVQYRDGRWRLVERERRNVGVWCGEPGDKHRRDPGEIELPEVAASAILRAWGYTLTTAENSVVCPKCRTFGCDHHTLPAAKPEANGNCQQESKPETLTQAKPADAPAVKENLTTDVPASSVHLRTDAHLSAVIGRVNGLADWLTALESRLAAVTESAANARQIADNQSDRLDELAERVRALEKPTTAGVVKVPAPVSHQGLFTDGELRVIDARDSAWRVALTAAGVKWEESK